MTETVFISCRAILENENESFHRLLIGMSIEYRSRILSLIDRDIDRVSIEMSIEYRLGCPSCRSGCLSSIDGDVHLASIEMSVEGSIESVG